MKLSKSREDILEKFTELIALAAALGKETIESPEGIISADGYFELRVSALNLLSVICGSESVYLKELFTISQTNANAFVIKGVLEAARNDYVSGFLPNQKLLASAEVFDDQLSAAQNLLDNDYEEAAAVITRAVLESGLKRYCSAKQIQFNDRDGIHDLNDRLYKSGQITKLLYSEIEAKKEIGNSAAHGRFDEFNQHDVSEFIAFSRRFLSSILV